MLPQIDSLAAYRPIYRDVATWLPALQVICRRHGFDPNSLRQAPPGSNIVFWVDPGCLVKLFAPMWKADAAREASALHALAEVLTIDVPRIVAEGSLEGWPYLIITRLTGHPLDEIWAGLAEGEQLEIARDLGRLIAALHSAPASGLDGLREDWQALLQYQVRNCVSQQQARGATSKWLAQISAFLAELPALAEPGFSPVLLHADLNPEHLFCTQAESSWRITGVIDFGDAMFGHPTYDFVAPGFLLGPSPALRRAMLLAYGFEAGDLTEALSRQMMAYTLLHRFANLPEILDRFGEHPPANMPELQAALWGFD